MKRIELVNGETLIVNPAHLAAAKTAESVDVFHQPTKQNIKRPTCHVYIAGFPHPLHAFDPAEMVMTNDDGETTAKKK